MERSSCAVQLEVRATPQHEIYLTDITRQRELQKALTTVHVYMYIRGNFETVGVTQSLPFIWRAHSH